MNRHCNITSPDITFTWSRPEEHSKFMPIPHEFHYFTDSAPHLRPKPIQNLHCIHWQRNKWAPILTIRKKKRCREETFLFPLKQPHYVILNHWWLSTTCCTWNVLENCLIPLKNVGHCYGENRSPLPSSIFNGSFIPSIMLPFSLNSTNK